MVELTFLQSITTKGGIGELVRPEWQQDSENMYSNVSYPQKIQIFSWGLGM
jgi:hypothetical protein